MRPTLESQVDEVKLDKDGRDEGQEPDGGDENEGSEEDEHIGTHLRHRALRRAPYSAALLRDSLCHEEVCKVCTFATAIDKRQMSLLISKASPCWHAGSRSAMTGLVISIQLSPVISLNLEPLLLFPASSSQPFRGNTSSLLSHSVPS